MTDGDKRTIRSCFTLFENTPRLPSIEIWAQLLGFQPQEAAVIADTISSTKQVSFHDESRNFHKESCGLGI